LGRCAVEQAGGVFQEGAEGQDQGHGRAIFGVGVGL
jgi:hypothetical protein